MPMRRIVLLSLALLIVGGSLGWTAAYGMRIRSENYRREVIADLAEFLSLPCEIAGVWPCTFSSRLFQDVRVWLPGRTDEVFNCRKALWQESDRSGGNALDLIDGRIRLGADRWEQRDPLKVLQRDLHDLQLTRVGLDRFEILFQRGPVLIHCREATGALDLADPSQEVARLTAYVLNGHRLASGAQIHARFRAGKGLEVSDLLLSLPEMPLQAAGLSELLGGRTTTGRFAGSIHYIADAAQPEVLISGELQDAGLSELTRALPIGPLEGRLSVKLSAMRIVDSGITDLRGTGQILDISLRPFAPLLGQPALSGQASFGVDALEIAEGRLMRLRLSGLFKNLSIDDWVRPLGRGSASGRLSIRVNNLDIGGETIHSADIELSLLPPPEGPGTLDRSLLLAVAEKAFRFAWPAGVPENILPDRIEYAECGLRLLITDNKLRILGTHGPRKETVLTIRAFGKPFGVLKEPSGVIDLTPHIQRYLELFRSLQPGRVREWLAPRQ